MANGLILTQNGIKIAKKEEYYYNRLKKLLFTEQNSMLGNPGWGSLIPKYMFEPMDEITIKDIIKETEFLINEYEPDLEIDYIYAELVNDDKNLAGLVMNIGLNILSTRQNIEFNFNEIITI